MKKKELNPAIVVAIATWVYVILTMAFNFNDALTNPVPYFIFTAIGVAVFLYGWFFQ